MAPTTTRSSRPEPVLTYGDDTVTIERRLRRVERKVRWLLAVLAIQSIFVVGYIAAMIYLFDYIVRHYTRF